MKIQQINQDTKLLSGIKVTAEKVRFLSASRKLPFILRDLVSNKTKSNIIRQNNMFWCWTIFLLNIGLLKRLLV